MTTTTELRDLADWLPLLGLMRTSRPPQEDAGVRVSRSADPQAPLRLETLDLEAEVHGVLVSWVRLAIEEGLTSDDWPADNALACCLWLHRNAHLIDEHAAGAEFVDEVHGIWRKMRRAVGEWEPRTMRHACSRCGNPSALINDGEVWACPECGREDDGPRRQIEEFRHAPSLPTDVICAQFGVTTAWLTDQRRRHGMEPDSAKGLKPLHWWPWDVFSRRNPALVDLWERHTEATSAP